MVVGPHDCFLLTGMRLCVTGVGYMWNIGTVSSSVSVYLKEESADFLDL